MSLTELRLSKLGRTGRTWLTAPYATIASGYARSERDGVLVMHVVQTLSARRKDQE